MKIVKVLGPLLLGILVLVVGRPLDGRVGQVATIAGLALVIYGLLHAMRALRQR